MKQNMCVLILILVFTSISLLSAQSISLEGVLSRLSEGTYGEVTGNYLFVLSDHITIYYLRHFGLVACKRGRRSRNLRKKN